MDLLPTRIFGHLPTIPVHTKEQQLPHERCVSLQPSLTSVRSQTRVQSSRAQKGGHNHCWSLLSFAAGEPPPSSRVPIQDLKQGDQRLDTAQLWYRPEGLEQAKCRSGWCSRPEHSVRGWGDRIGALEPVRRPLRVGPDRWEGTVDSGARWNPNRQFLAIFFARQKDEVYFLGWTSSE